jgi:hypothetical protein
MFCLDFAFAFIVHGMIVKWSQSEGRFMTHSATSTPGVTPGVAWTFGLGAVSGVGSAIALYPFDIVRMSVLEKGKSHFAFSTVPYMSIYLGTYFTLRNERGTFLEKFALANVSAGLGAVAELPFDQAKLNISGSTRMAIVTSALRIPLAALLLVSYDQILVGKKIRNREADDENER